MGYSGAVAGGGALAMAFGTISADLFESSRNRSPEPAVLFYATDDDTRQGIRAVDPKGRLRAGEDRRNRTVGSPRGGRRPSRLVVDPAEARSLIGGA